MIPSAPFSIPGTPKVQLDLQLTNLAINYTVRCSITSLDLGSFVYAENHGDRWYDCGGYNAVGFVTPEHFAPSPFSKRPLFDVRTLVRFDRPPNRVSVDQTWYCDGGDHPYAFSHQLS